MKRINNTDYYTPAEVLQQFGIGKSTLVRWRRLYHIEFIAVGRHVYYPVSEIARVIKEATTHDSRPVTPSHTSKQANKQTNVQTNKQTNKAYGKQSTDNSTGV